MNLPNVITLGRLLSVPIAIYLILQSAYLAAFTLFVSAGVSDALDGYIAKKYHKTTKLGALLDPLADKALLVGVYVTLGYQGHLLHWLVVLVVFRDLMILGGVILMFIVRLEVKMRPLFVSKSNTAAQIALAAIILAKLGLSLSISGVIEVAVYVVAASTVVSGAGYIVSWAKHMTGVEEDSTPTIR